MNTLDFKIASQYKFQFSASPIFECALDVAAFTREEVYDKLNRSLGELHAMRDRMSGELRQAVTVAGEVHTWRSLLFLVHRCTALVEFPMSEHLEVFVNWMLDNESHLIELASPYLGDIYAADLKRAISGDVTAQQALLQDHSDNPVIHLNLRYLFSVDAHTLYTHLRSLVEGWYHQFIEPALDETVDALRQSDQLVKQLTHTTVSSDLIRIITKGGELQPLPGVDTLWLIPQIAYRPFTIINYLPHSVVYYYPVDDEFLPGDVTLAKMMHAATLHKALGDIQRIRLLTLIRHSPKSLGDLTRTLNATKSNIHHHLTLLRAAGLVTVEDGVYAINHNAIFQVGDELRTLLAPDPEK